MSLPRHNTNVTLEDKRNRQRRRRRQVKKPTAAVGMDTNATAATSTTNNRKYCNGMASSTSSAAPIEHRKKTWSELKESVTDLRKQLSRLATMIPMNIEFRQLTDGRTRVYFLSMPPNGWETTLLCTDIPPNVNGETNDNSTQTVSPLRQRLNSLLFARNDFGSRPKL